MITLQNITITDNEPIIINAGPQIPEALQSWLGKLVQHAETTGLTVGYVDGKTRQLHDLLRVLYGRWDDEVNR